MMADNTAACLSQLHDAEEVDGHSCSKETPKPYSEKTDLTSGILVVSGSSLYIGKELLSLYSPILKEMFANAEVGELYELPVVKIDDESVDDIILLLDLIYPDTGKTQLDDSNLVTALRLSHEYQIKALRQKCITYIQSKEPKLIYRQLADKYNLKELRDRLKDEQLVQKVPTSSIDQEIKDNKRLELHIPLNLYRLKLEKLEQAIRSVCGSESRKRKYYYQTDSYKDRCDLSLKKNFMSGNRPFVAMAASDFEQLVDAIKNC